MVLRCHRVQRPYRSYFPFADMTQWQKWQEFIREFLRVNFDKALLLACMFWFWHLGDREMMKACMLAVGVTINHNRFRWNP
jgi:hypothetical protein